MPLTTITFSTVVLYLIDCKKNPTKTLLYVKCQSMSISQDNLYCLGSSVGLTSFTFELQQI